MLSDGHSSRFDIKVLRHDHEKEMNSHISPTDTTSTTQPLDQINASLHSSYTAECEKFFRDNHINREVFMEVLAEIWGKWTTPESIIKAFKRCGISKDGLSIEWMQKEKMAAAEALLLTEKTPEKMKEVWEVDSPEGVRCNTKEYFQRKYEEARRKLEELSNKPLSPDEVPGLFTYEKIRAPARKTIRLTQIQGSLEGSAILELREAAETERIEKENKKDESAQKKKVVKENFIKCKYKCVCNEIVCKASAYKECPVCGDIMKSQCTKQKCMVEKIKPLMTLSWYDAEKKSNCSKLKGNGKGKRHIDRAESLESDDTDISSDSEYYSHKYFKETDNPVSDKMEDEDVPMTYGDVNAGMWVIVFYEDKKFLGKVQAKQAGQFKVLCLDKPFGINVAQCFESGDGIFYSKVYKTNIEPMQTQIGEDGRKSRKWFWKY